MGVNQIIDAKRITTVPIIFIPIPALIKSIILTLPLENIIALGGVARNKILFRIYIKKKPRFTNR
jgi:hypothetical protein